jgi:hypothetical protein
LPEPQAGYLLGTNPIVASRRPGRRSDDRDEEETVIVLGVILLVLGWLLGIQLLTYLGGILLVVGVVLLLLGSAGRAVGPRRHYF